MTVADQSECLNLTLSRARFMCMGVPSKPPFIMSTHLDLPVCSPTILGEHSFAETHLSVSSWTILPHEDVELLSPRLPDGLFLTEFSVDQIFLQIL